MLTPGEDAALDALRTARDALAAEPGGDTAVVACEQAIAQVYALGGFRDSQNAEQADYLAEQVVLLMSVVEQAAGATAVAEVLPDGTTSVTVEVPPQVEVPAEPVVEP